MWYENLFHDPVIKQRRQEAANLRETRKYIASYNPIPSEWLDALPSVYNMPWSFINEPEIKPTWQIRIEQYLGFGFIRIKGDL
jgi:hypothetical protein